MDILTLLQPLVYLAALWGFVWTVRKDSKEDYIRLEAKLEVWRDETNSKIESWRSESNKKFDLVHEEIKDFHGKMCAIEERRKKVIK
jgi:RPA family protein